MESSNKLPLLTGMKAALAKDIITKCIGTNGVWASRERYANQCWTRDFCLATSPVLLYDPDLKNLDIVRIHLMQLLERQKPNGKIPILYLDDEHEFLRDKITKSIETHKMSFMLKRYLDKDIENLTPHTRDSEVLFIIAVGEFLIVEPMTPYKDQLLAASRLAMEYIKSILVDGLILGADWRDIRDDLDDKPVLTNACLLYRAYQVLGETESAKKVKDILNQKYWVSNNFETVRNKMNNKYLLYGMNDYFSDHFCDYPGSTSFDMLGNALAILYDIADKDQTESIFRYVTTNLRTPAGFKTTETFLPALTTEEKHIMEKDKAVVWPFVNGFILNAMLLKGGPKWQDIARNEFAKWEKLHGFYEWYDINEGKGYGSKDQVWSAALFLRVNNNIN